MRRGRQLAFELKARPSWGGRREGAGRKPKGKIAGVPHEKRPTHHRSHPAHVTLRVLRGLPNLRKKRAFGAVRRSIAAGSDRFGFRLVHFSVQSNHIHLLVEAADERALSRGVKGFEVRVARALNKLFERKGALFADRYHARDLKTPRETRAALAYLLLNWNHHRELSPGARAAIRATDPCTSSACFDVWEPASKPIIAHEVDVPVAAPRTWLLSVGWRERGRLRPNEVPGERKRRARRPA